MNGTGERFILFAGLDDLMLKSIMLGCVRSVFGCRSFRTALGNRPDLDSPEQQAGG